ncbi:HU domain-containing protein [Flavobacterium gilvum]|uniref:Sporulation protein n=1 Tax=Flavobacterium gilvum TaxID=1492737 RepID=A0AAC9N6F2_9FLAO|nr:SPOR domain-containing protein [Flavobacterium gilvum]AOW08788.1 sporulation protein [Flavobacterium gilvum]KFC59148.1 sporulation protein [Flavobacterium gilvum]
MKIELYISQLLYRYQCVTVPGFGAFLTEIQSAQLLENSHSFFPPKKMISFNTHIKNNDGLLANHIAQVEKTSYDYAVSAIEYEVLNWKKTLQENRTFLIKNIGVLSLNAENNIIFTPNEQTNYLAQSFGLTPFVSPAVKREVELPKAEIVVEKTATNIEEETPVFNLESETRERSPFLKYAAVFVIGLAVAGSIGYPMYQNQIASERVLVEATVQKKVQKKIQEATFFIQSPIPAVTLSLKSNKEEKEEVAKLPYHIMAGAFRSEANAQKRYRQLIAKGFDARVLGINKNGLYPVLYGSYATFAEAEKEKDSITETDNPEAWILIQSL